MPKAPNDIVPPPSSLRTQESTTAVPRALVELHPPSSLRTQESTTRPKPRTTSPPRRHPCERRNPQRDPSPARHRPPAVIPANAGIHNVPKAPNDIVPPPSCLRTQESTTCPKPQTTSSPRRHPRERKNPERAQSPERNRPPAVMPANAGIQNVPKAPNDIVPPSSSLRTQESTTCPKPRTLSSHLRHSCERRNPERDPSPERHRPPAVIPANAGIHNVTQAPNDIVPPPSFLRTQESTTCPKPERHRPPAVMPANAGINNVTQAPNAIAPLPSFLRTQESTT